jgi:glycerol-3-phosphate acyltransferase PlsY
MVALLVGAYLLGSVDFGVVVARLRGHDIYSEGSGNPGASNVFRSVSRTAGVAVLVLDLCKGLAVALVGVAISGPSLGAAAGVAAVAGHCYPVFHRFHGGKGAATLAGVMFGLFPVVAAVLLVVFVVLVAVTRVAAIGTIAVTLAAIPGAAWAGGRRWTLIWVGLGAFLVLYRHHGNIGRLVHGTERKVVGE